MKLNSNLRYLKFFFGGDYFMHISSKNKPEQLDQADFRWKAAYFGEEVLQRYDRLEHTGHTDGQLRSRFSEGVVWAESVVDNLMAGLQSLIW